VCVSPASTTRSASTGWPIVTGGLVAYPFSMAWNVLRHFRDIT
jgi:hypothetical protein